MKKRIKVDLSWRVWSLITGVFILIGYIGLSFAYNANSLGGNPSIMGHSADEIEGGVGSGACIPDYLHGVNKNNDISYQATSDGWVQYSTTMQYGCSAFSVSSNNSYWVDLMSMCAGDWPQRDLGSISPIKTGTYYKGTALKVFVFYPCISSTGSTGGSSTSSSLSCRIAFSTSSSPVTVCCNSDEYAMGVNSAELNIKSSFTSDKCVYFSEVDTTAQKQVVCCKTV